ncbi:MAG TPA: hypothetical protein VGG94_08605 [Chthoniobacterales bacterium]|jgi:hypothetical protein
MKTILSICLVVALAGTAWADPQKKSYGTTATKKPASSKAAPAPPVSQGRDVQGAIPRGFRGGNPLQMVNPKAPARYGTWVDNTSFDPNVPGKWKGIKLFEIVF